LTKGIHSQLASFSRVVEFPEYLDSQMMPVASLSLAGREDEARDAFRQYITTPKGAAKSISEVKARQPYETPLVLEFYNRVYDGLTKAGMPQQPPARCAADADPRRCFAASGSMEPLARCNITCVRAQPLWSNQRPKGDESAAAKPMRDAT
jgi:hypothetical protein